MKPFVYLIGVGMGNPDTLTAEASCVIAECDTLIGAQRLLNAYPDKPCVPLTSSSEILWEIQSIKSGTVGVLFSGDTGFFSGANSLWKLLDDYETRTICGVSSVTYFCAKIQKSWHDACLVSAHGREHNAIGEIQRHEKTLVLTGGKTTVSALISDLRSHGLGFVALTVGSRLSYPDEEIIRGTADELASRDFPELSVVYAENPAPLGGEFSVPGIPDKDFLRGDAPMTKEEVRALSISKLRLSPAHTIWDVGAGTGSVSVECALSVPAGFVYAVEKDKPAFDLLIQNKQRFNCVNLHAVFGEAPAVLRNLPAPDRVFIGGSSGNLRNNLTASLEKNPRVRIVINAVTLETLTDALSCFNELQLDSVDISQIAVTKIKNAGNYHMMDALNPVWIIAGEGRP